jgi:hypothetical protein
MAPSRSIESIKDGSIEALHAPIVPQIHELVRLRSCRAVFGGGGGKGELEGELEGGKGEVEGGGGKGELEGEWGDAADVEGSTLGCKGPLGFGPVPILVGLFRN